MPFGAVLKLSYATFEGGFFIFSSKLFEKYCSIRTKKMHRMKMKKNGTLLTFLNRLKHTHSITFAKVRTSILDNLGCIALGLHILWVDY